MGESRDSAGRRAQLLSRYGVLGALWVLGCAWPLSARGHGPQPAVVGVLAADSAGPRILLLTEGFAALGAGGAEFVCPARFGVERTPLAASALHTTWVAGSPSATLWAVDGSTATGDARVTDNSVIAFASGAGRLLALTYGSAGSDVLALDDTGATALFHLAVGAATLAVDGESVWVAAVRGYVAHVQRSNTAGGEVVATDVSLAGTPRTLSLRSAGGRMFLHATLDNRSELYELGAPVTDAILRQAAPIFGPVAEGDTLWVGLTDGLTRLDDRDPTHTPLALDSAIHCLEERAGVAYVCSQTGVFRVSDVARAGNNADPVWTLSALHAPTSAAMADPTCTAQWLTFRADVVRAGITLPENDAGASETAHVPDRADAGSADDGAVAVWTDAAEPTPDAADPTADAGTISRGHSASACTLAARRSERSAYLPGALLGALCAVNAYRRRARVRSQSRIS